MNCFKIFSLIFILLSIFSCKEETDENPPIINLTSPTENTQYFVLESIPIRATITDDENIKSVQVSLIQEQSGKKVLGSLFYTPNTSNYRLEATFKLSDSLLASGSYYFRIEALDENNTAVVFQYIRVIGIPKKKIELIAFCGLNSSTTVYADKNDFNFQQKTVFNAPYFSSTINNYDQQLWFLPADNSSMLAFHLNENAIQFNQSVMSGFNSAFTDLVSYNRSVLVSTKEGEILGYSENYAKNYNYQTLGDRTINKLAANKNYVIADEADLNGDNRMANILFESTGAVKSRISINYSCVDIYFLEEEQVILFQNDEQGGRISELNIQANARRTVKTFADSIVAVEQVKSDEYLLSTATKVLKYNYSNGNLIDYLFTPYAVVRYDDFDNQLYVAAGNELKRYNYPFNSPIESTTLPEEIKGLEVRFNR